MLACYGVWLADRGYKPSTVATRLAAVGWWNKLRGYGDPSKEFLVKRLLKGLRKGGPPKKQATPIRYGLLTRLVKSLPTFLPRYEAVMFKAVFLLAYFASLRISEYTGASQTGNGLRLKDVGFQVVEGTRGLVLMFKSYKASKRPAKLFVPQAADPDCCPVNAVEQYLRMRPRGGGTPPPFSFGSPATNSPRTGSQKCYVRRRNDTGCLRKATPPMHSGRVEPQT